MRMFRNSSPGASARAAPRVTVLSHCVRIPFASRDATDCLPDTYRFRCLNEVRLDSIRYRVSSQTAERCGHSSDATVSHIICRVGSTERAPGTARGLPSLALRPKGRILAEV